MPDSPRGLLSCQERFPADRRRTGSGELFEVILRPMYGSPKESCLSEDLDTPYPHRWFSIQSTNTCARIVLAPHAQLHPAAAAAPVLPNTCTLIKREHDDNLTSGLPSNINLTYREMFTKTSHQAMHQMPIHAVATTSTENTFAMLSGTKPRTYKY